MYGHRDRGIYLWKKSRKVECKKLKYTHAHRDRGRYLWKKGRKLEFQKMNKWHRHIFWLRNLAFEKFFPFAISKFLLRSSLRSKQTQSIEWKPHRQQHIKPNSLAMHLILIQPSHTTTKSIIWILEIKSGWQQPHPSSSSQRIINDCQEQASLHIVVIIWKEMWAAILPQQ